MNLHPSDYAWAVLIAGVVAWEIFSPPGELLSEAVDRHLVRHPVITRAAILITAAHLLNALEVRPLQWIDIYAHIARIGNR